MCTIHTHTHKHTLNIQSICHYRYHEKISSFALENESKMFFIMYSQYRIYLFSRIFASTLCENNALN